MLRRIQTSLSATILLKLGVAVTTLGIVLFGVGYFLLRSFLLGEYRKNVRDYATVLADQGRRALEAEIDSGRHPLDDFMGFEYTELTIDECMEQWVRPEDRSQMKAEYLEKIFQAEEKKADGNVDRYRRYSTRYTGDENLAATIRRLEDGYLGLSSLAFAVLMDKNGLVPFHHTANSKTLTGDLKKDLMGNRTNRKWDYLGRGISPDGVVDTEYVRDTGVVTITAYAPITLKGQFWGGVVVGYNVADIQSKVRSIVLGAFAAIGLALLCVFFGLYFLINRSLAPIQGVSQLLSGVAQGDFSRTIELESANEVGTIARSANMMIAQVSGTIDHVKSAATSLATSSQELTSTSASLGKNSVEQVEKLRQVWDGLDRMFASISDLSDFITDEFKDISVAAEAVNRLEGNASLISQNMTAAKAREENSIHTARQGVAQVETATAVIQRIVESSNRIAGMVTIIDDISDQINLLSLNASIEAARAGDAGRGFAVVAEQIGRLAERTSVQVKEIHGMSGEIESNVRDGSTVVGDISKGISRIMEDILANARMIHEVVGLTEKQAEQHNSMRSLMTHLHQKAAGIMATGEAQRAASETMRQSVRNVMDSASGISAASEEIAAASEDLARRSEELNHLVDAFRTKGQGEPGPLEGR